VPHIPYLAPRLNPYGLCHWIQPLYPSLPSIQAAKVVDRQLSQEVADLLAGPRSVRASGESEDVDDREPTSMTKRQYRRRNVTVQSMWKSVARMVVAWTCRNCRQVVTPAGSFATRGRYGRSAATARAAGMTAKRTALQAHPDGMPNLGTPCSVEIAHFRGQGRSLEWVGDWEGR
jgi:hypothetical protein